MTLRHVKRSNRIDPREHYSLAFMDFADAARCLGKFHNARSVAVYEKDGYFRATMDYESDPVSQLPPHWYVWYFKTGAL